MNLRFPGQYYDVETGTHYNFHRDYRPNAGRYVQSDPIGLGGGLGFYLYADNTPLIHIDSLGLSPAGMGGRGAMALQAAADAIDHGKCGWWPYSPECQGQKCVLWRCKEERGCGETIEWEYGRGVSSIVPVDYNPNKDPRCKCILYCAIGKPNCRGLSVE